MISLSIFSTVLVALFLFFFAIQIFFYLYYFSGVYLSKRRASNDRAIFSNETPPVSVIICARNEEDNLKNFLPKVLTQNYKNFEVIVVNDNSEDNTDIVLNQLKRTYSNLYIATVSPEVKVFSRKKFALTLGIKAAQNEVLLFTDADCEPISEDWISLMIRNMGKDTEYVIGYGDYQKKKSFLNYLITFDTLFIAMQYFGLAFRGVPYMAVGRNLMYKKSSFMARNGFAGHLHLRSGDDDININKYGNRTNMKIEVEADSKTISVPEKSFFRWINQKKRHLTTSGLYSRKSKNIIGVEILSRALFYAFFVFLLILFHKNMILISIVSGIFVLRYLVQALVINKSASILNSRKFFVSIIILDIILPIISLSLLIGNSRKV